jgi:hypothetical protein
MKRLRELGGWAILLGATFALCEVGNINAFVLRLTGHTWNLRNYFFTMFSLVTFIWLWLPSRWKPSPSLPVIMVQVLLGIGTGHVVAILSYLVAVLLGPDGFERLVNSLRFLNVLEHIIVLFIMPVILLGWLYGGVFVSLYILGRVIVNRRAIGRVTPVEDRI